MGSESSDWDFVHVDEPCPEDMFKACARGLVDRQGKTWFTLTSIDAVWITDMFEPSDPKDVQPDRWFREGTTYENPHLTPAGIKAFESLLTDDEKQCRLLGKPMELSGLVYKEFRYDTHVFKHVPFGWKGYDDPPPEYVIYTAIDTHPRVPHAVLFIAVGPSGLPIVYDELFIHTSATELCSLIRRKLSARRFAPVKCEPAAWIEDPETGRSLATAFAEGGLVVWKASKGKTHGILTLKGLFNKRDPLGLMFCPTVHRTLWEIRRYCYDPKTNEPVDKDDHMMENLYRLMINNPEWYDSEDKVGPIGDEEFSTFAANPFNKDDEVVEQDFATLE
jgi:hypothetical protein